jgi:hypothetical protein
MADKQFTWRQKPGLPDGIYSYKKSQFGYNLEGLGIENLGIFYGTWEYLRHFVGILRPFGILCGHLVIFYRFGMLYREKSGNPAKTPIFFFGATKLSPSVCRPSFLTGRFRIRPLPKILFNFFVKFFSWNFVKIVKILWIFFVKFCESCKNFVKSESGAYSETWTQSYDRKLQRQRC